MSTLKVNGIRHTGASSDAITTASDGTATAKLTEVSGGQLSHRNLIRNGGMRVSQRSTSNGSVGTGSGYPALDRWAYNIDLPGGVSNFTISQETDAPDGGFAASLKITPNQSRSGSLSGADRVFIQHKLEAQDVRGSGWDYTDASKYMTYSFYIKSNLTGIVTVEVNAPDTSSSYQYYHETISISSANTWERKSIKIYGNANLVFNNDNDVGMVLNFHLMSGPTFNSGSLTTGSWHDNTSGNRSSSSNIDITSSSSNYVSLTGVQLEVGDMTKFEHISYGDDLQRCQRYYQKYTSISWRVYTANVHRSATPLAVRMRAGATVTKTYNNQTNYGTDNTGCSVGDMIQWDIQRSGASTGVVDNANGTLTFDSEL